MKLRLAFYCSVTAALSWLFDPLAGLPVLFAKNWGTKLNPLEMLTNPFGIGRWTKEPEVKLPESSAPQPATPPPTKKSESEELETARLAEEEKARRRRAGGEAGTILAGPLAYTHDDASFQKAGGVKRKTLLGA